MKNLFSKEQLQEIGKIGAKIGKSILVEGTKAVVLKGAATAITTSFDEGFGAIKDLKLDDYLEGPRRKSKAIFKTKETVEVVDLEKPEVTE